MVYNLTRWWEVKWCLEDAVEFGDKGLDGGDGVNQISGRVGWCKGYYG